MKLLLEAGADPTITNQAGHDAVYEAELNDKREVVEWVLKEGGEGLEEGIGREGEGEGEEDGDEDMGVDEPEHEPEREGDAVPVDEGEEDVRVAIDKLDVKDGMEGS